MLKNELVEEITGQLLKWNVVFNHFFSLLLNTKVIAFFTFEKKFVRLTKNVKLIG